ncbi:YtzI protein [Bacillus sp. FJAT-42376]|uniref:YtzI protein n=1 Tax=Bacillus sp. FJAT-42376 TaxID=2014076 RepID=UPI000F4E00D0|nr:YtzI protein [Bacillus sp. FJAT-42376]AZB44085.1 YtzI protein [Bacillus sp. FJAT-42376]
MYGWIMGICIAIVFAVLALSLVTTKKAYKFEHTIDPEEENKSAPPMDESNSAEK